MRRTSCPYVRHEHFSLKILQILAIFSVGFFLSVHLLLPANLNDKKPLACHHLWEFSKCSLQHYRFSVEISVLVTQNLPNSVEKIKTPFDSAVCITP